MKTWFVTGVSGFVGGHVARQLTARGDRVRAVVRSPERISADPASTAVHVFRGDVTDKESMREAMRAVDGAFHVAGWYKIGRKNREVAVATNVVGTRNVLELVQELRIPKVVYTSTLAVNSDTHGRMVDETYRFTGSHISLYDETKARAHDIAMSFAARGVPVSIVQPGLVYGPGDTSSIRTMLVQYLQRRLPLVPLKTAFAWGHVDDIAAGHLLAMERGEPGRNYFLAGPVHTLEEALHIAEQITGIPPPRVHAPPVLLRAAARAMSLVERFVALPPEYTAEGLRVIAGTTYIGDGERARRELGWTPRPLAVGLAETLREMQTL
jgi:nucleoside-diphosphate-sugar epimerase